MRVSLFACMLCTVATSGASAQVVLTEGFESPVTPNYITYNAGAQINTGSNVWHVIATGIDLGNDAARSEVVACEGLQAIDMAGSPGAGIIETEFAATIGVQYELVFHYSRNNFIASGVASMTATVAGSGTLLATTVTHATPRPFDECLEFRGTFTASGPTVTLRFASNNTGNHGIVLDGISIAAVPMCDSIDFNNDGLFPDTADIDDFLSVFSGGPCSTGTCGDIDFNNDGLFPDTLDIDSLLSVFSGGACL